MMFQDLFEQLLSDYPDAVSDRRKLAGISLTRCIRSESFKTYKALHRSTMPSPIGM